MGLSVPNIPLIRENFAQILWWIGSYMDVLGVEPLLSAFRHLAAVLELDRVDLERQEAKTRPRNNQYLHGPGRTANWAIMFLQDCRSVEEKHAPKPEHQGISLVQHVGSERGQLTMPCSVLELVSARH